MHVANYHVQEPMWQKIERKLKHQQLAESDILRATNSLRNIIALNLQLSLRGPRRMIHNLHTNHRINITLLCYDIQKSNFLSWWVAYDKFIMSLTIFLQFDYDVYMMAIVKLTTEPIYLIILWFQKFDILSWRVVYDKLYNVTDKIPSHSIMMCTNKTLGELTAKEIEHN